MQITLDGDLIDVPEGATLLEVARHAGIDVPTLCDNESPWLTGCDRSTSCLVCVMKTDGRVVPSCAMRAVAGMVVESETEEVRVLRRTALELLLSDHQGDCHAPCEYACPAHPNLPEMLRHLASGDREAAWRVFREAIPFPATLGHICQAPCEKSCRRRTVDTAIPIRQLHRELGLAAIESTFHNNSHHRESCHHVVIIGGGLCGLTAARLLTRSGIAVTLFERSDKLGGRVRQSDTRQSDTAMLPPEVLDAEIAMILREPLLTVFTQTEIALELLPKSLVLGATQIDAILVATGGTASDTAPLPSTMPSLFVAGSRLAPRSLAIRSVAEGQRAATEISSFLATGYCEMADRKTADKSGRIGWGVRQRGTVPIEPADIPPAAVSQETVAAACLHCDCRGRDSCRLLHYARLYQADPQRYQEQRRKDIHQTVPRVCRSLVLRYEILKCIKCGLCVRIANSTGEKIGLAVTGRGFGVKISPPFDSPLETALAPETARRCAAACPTAALTTANTTP